MNFIEAIILAIIEGITEYLPISSTGHMIIGSSLMGISELDFTKVFEVNIQFGAITPGSDEQQKSQYIFLLKHTKP